MKKFAINKTYQEINEKIQAGDAVVVTAEEMIGLVKDEGPVDVARHVDVVTTGTFAPMCSSGAFINFGHATPGIKASKVWLNNVSAYGGIAAVDCYIGATEPCEDDPLNKVYPGEFTYGGGHVIHDLVAGKTPAPLVFLAQNEAGYLNLLKLNSFLYLDKQGAQPEVTMEQLVSHAEGLICLTGGPEGPVARHLREGHPERAEALLRDLSAAFPTRLYVELQRHPGANGLPEATVSGMDHKDIAEIAMVTAGLICSNEYP